MVQFQPQYAQYNPNYAPYASNMTTPVAPAQTPAPQAAQNPSPTQPSASVGAVQIYISNPTVNAGGNANAGVAAPQSYPPNYYMPQQNIQNNNYSGGQQQGLVSPPASTPTQPVQQQPAAPAQPQNNSTQTQQTEKKDDKKADKKPIVPLTDEYIMSLENYLNSQNSQVRLMAAKEIIKRLKEDDSRKSDPALTNLLNKALQDPSQGVRLLALSALDAGYSNGDEYTDQLLQNMQNSKAVYNEDATLAASIQLKLQGFREQAKLEQAQQPQSEQQPQAVDPSQQPSPVDPSQPAQAPQEAAQPQVGQNLNLQSQPMTQSAYQQPQVGQKLNMMAG